jgi:hypothetical protein
MMGLLFDLEIGLNSLEMYERILITMCLIGISIRCFHSKSNF